MYSYGVSYISGNADQTMSGDLATGLFRPDARVDRPLAGHSHISETVPRLPQLSVRD